MSGTRQSGNRKQGASPKRNTSKKSQTNTKKTAVKQENDLGAEIRLVVLLIVSILLFFSNFGIGGKVGDMMSSFLFGCLGQIGRAHV